jgi:carbon storage regulator CsrA
VLVLSRKAGQQIVLPDCGVTIDVVAVTGRRVRLGITAPSGTRVHRTEVWQRICQPDGSGPKQDGNGHGGNGRGRSEEAVGRPAPAATGSVEFNIDVDGT